MSISLSTVQNQFGVTQFSQAYAGGGKIPSYAYYLDQSGNGQPVPHSGAISLSQLNGIYSNSGSITYSQPGLYYWTCPVGITQLTLTYPDSNSGSGTSSQVVTVIPGVTYDVNIGPSGLESYFGSYQSQHNLGWFHYVQTYYLATIPAYRYKVLH